MQTLSLHELSKRSDLELDVLYQICSQKIQKSAPYDTLWLSATMTAAHIIRVRSMRSRDVKKARV